MNNPLCLWFSGYDSPEYVGFSRVRMRLIDHLKKHGFTVFHGGKVPPKNCIQISWGQPFNIKEDREVWDRKDGVSYSVGYTVFESSKMPNEWAENFKQHDVAASASSFCVDSLMEEFKDKLIDMPVYKISHGVDSTFFPPLLRDYNRGTKENSDPFTFLWVGMNPSDRKRGSLVEKCFKKLKLPNCKLILKFVPLHSSPGIFYDVDKVSSISQYYKHNELLSLLYNSDAFIYPTRCEGFGLQPLEFGATGLPVSTTAYSGQMDYIYDGKEVWKTLKDRVDSKLHKLFMDDNGELSAICLPLKDYKISDSFYIEEQKRLNKLKEKGVEVKYLKDIDYGEWEAKDALVSDEEVCTAMELMYENQKDFKEIANSMSRHIHANWTWDRAVSDMIRMFESMGILKDIQWETPMSFTPEANFLKVGNNSIRYPTITNWPEEPDSKITNPDSVVHEYEKQNGEFEIGPENS